MLNITSSPYITLTDVLIAVKYRYMKTNVGVNAEVSCSIKNTTSFQVDMELIVREIERATKANVSINCFKGSLL